MAAARLAVVFFAVAFVAVVFLAVVFLAVDFLAVAFFAAVFLAVAFFAGARVVDDAVTAVRVTGGGGEVGGGGGASDDVGDDVRLVAPDSAARPRIPKNPPALSASCANGASR